MSDTIVAEFDAELAKDERELIERARAFGAGVVAPRAQGWGRSGNYPTEALRLGCAEGLARMELDPDSGGHGFRFSSTMRVVEELARHDFGIAFSLINHHNATARIARAARSMAERLVPRMLTGELIGCSAYTEPEHGSDLAALTTTATKVEGGWRLDGRKAWITNAAVAGVVIVLAQTAPGSGSKGIASFIVEADRPGFAREPSGALLGAEAIGVGGLRLEDYLAPDDAVLAMPGEGFKQALGGINRARCYVAAMCAGMLEAALTRAIDYGNTRQAFGRPIIAFQGLRWSLVDAQTDLAALRLLAYRAARLIDAGQNAEQAAAQAKKFAGQRVIAHLAACIQAMGAAGLAGEYPLVRHLLAAKIAGFVDGTTEMMNERLGKLLSQHVAPGRSTA
jgi:alkylation response protein AidB-like acyl-CoA dehydrogenase